MESPSTSCYLKDFVNILMISWTTNQHCKVKQSAHLNFKTNAMEGGRSSGLSLLSRYFSIAFSIDRSFGAGWDLSRAKHSADFLLIKLFMSPNGTRRGSKMTEISDWQWFTFQKQNCSSRGDNPLWKICSDHRKFLNDPESVVDIVINSPDRKSEDRYPVRYICG